MKTRFIFLASILMILLPGCLVKSLHPFYTEKDQVFREDLIGSWSGEDSTRWEIARHMKSTGHLKPSVPGKAYDIIYRDGKGESSFIAHLFMLDKQLYLDFYPNELACGTDLGGFHLVPAHTLAKVSVSKNKLVIRWYNEEWLMSLFNQNRVRIAHERVPYDHDDPNPEQQQVILTAPTADLQKFILKYGNDPGAFEKGKDKSDYTFVLNRKAIAPK